MKTSKRLNSSIQHVQENHGLTPDQISCGGMTVSFSAPKSVICSETRFHESGIIACLNLVDSEETFSFDSLLYESNQT